MFVKGIDQAVKEEIDKAVKEAKADGEISLEELSADVYSENLEGALRGITAADKLKHINLGPRINYN